VSEPSSGASRRANQGKVGVPERLVVTGFRGPPTTLCITVSAEPRAGAAKANPNQPYTLTFRHHVY
jgi:hypothetical protein